MRRARMTRGHSKRVFRAGAGYHPKNMAQRPMRGGWRL